MAQQTYSWLKKRYMYPLATVANQENFPVLAQTCLCTKEVHCTSTVMDWFSCMNSWVWAPSYAQFSLPGVPKQNLTLKCAPVHSVVNKKNCMLLLLLPNRVFRGFSNSSQTPEGTEGCETLIELDSRLPATRGGIPFFSIRTHAYTCVKLQPWHNFIFFIAI